MDHGGEILIDGDAERILLQSALESVRDVKLFVQWNERARVRGEPANVPALVYRHRENAVAVGEIEVAAGLVGGESLKARIRPPLLRRDFQGFCGNVQTQDSLWLQLLDQKGTGRTRATTKVENGPGWQTQITKTFREPEHPATGEEILGLTGDGKTFGQRFIVTRRILVEFSLRWVGH